jgi:hypothetical protein
MPKKSGSTKKRIAIAMAGEILRVRTKSTRANAFKTADDRASPENIVQSEQTHTLSVTFFRKTLQAIHAIDSSTCPFSHLMVHFFRFLT